MKRRFSCLFALAAAAGAAACFLSFAGPLDPPAGPVAPTFKTLTQVEPRIDVATLPGNAFARHVIVTPGSYYMSANVAGAPGISGISIVNDNIVLDMNGFALTGQAGSGDGVVIAGTRANIVIKNGTIRSWGGEGIDAADETNVQVSNMNVSHNAADGVLVGPNSIITNCAASSNGGDGFQLGEGSTIQNCTAALNAVGINVPGTGAGSAPGTGGATIHACAAHRNVGNGIQGTHMSVAASTASFNGINGIQATNSSVSDCEARGNTQHGFGGGGNVFSRCKTRSNQDDGFNVSEGTLVDRCVSRGNVGDAFELSQEASILFCHAEDCAVGIRITGTDCRVEANTAVRNGQGGVVVEAGIGGCVVVGNRVSGFNAYSVGPNNMLGTVVSAEAGMNAATNSLINIVY